MPADAEIIIDVDVESDKIDKKLKTILDEIASKKVALAIETKDLIFSKKQLFELDNLIKSLKNPDDELIKFFQNTRDKVEKATQKIFILRENINLLSSEFRKLIKLQSQMYAYKQMMSRLLPSSQIAGLLPNNTPKLLPSYSTMMPIEIIPKINEQEIKIIDKRIRAISSKTILLEAELSNEKSIKSQIKSLKEEMDKLGDSDPRLAQKFSKLNNELEKSKNKIFILKQELNGMKESYNNSFNIKKPIILPSTIDQLRNANVEIKKITDSSSNFSNLKSNILSASNHVDYFSKKILNLLKSAFVFNIISKYFRGLAALLGNLINRDTIFAKSLMIVQANLVRAFAPIWKAILPWIRLLGEALIWLSKIFIKFINFLTGSNIKPVETFKDAKQVVGDFYKIASPKKDMFDLKKPIKNTNRLKKNLNKAQKESNKLLASFDELEVLEFDKNKLAKDPFELEELKKTKINDKNLNLIVDDTIKNIQNKPLDFIVNDNIGEQITSQVNGLELPTLNFVVDEKSQDTINSFKEKINPILEGISEIAKKTGESFADLFNDIANSEASKKAVGFLSTFFDKISEGIQKTSKYENIGTIIRDVIIGIGTAFTTFQIITNFGKLISLASNIFSMFTNIGLLFSPAGLISVAVGVLALIIIHWKDIKEWAVKAWESIKSFGNYLSGKFSETWDGIKNSAKRAFEGITGFVGRVGDFITNNIVNPIKSAFGFGGGDHFGLSTSSIKVPHLAQGSVLKGGDPFLAYLNDQPRGQTNVEAPLSTIVDAFRQALSESDFNNQPEININASGDMSGIVRMLNFKLQDNKEISGNAFIDNIN